MKEKRNCAGNMNYPIYQQGFVQPMPYPMPYQPYGQISSNTYEQQLNNLNQQINMLDQRVTRLEKLNTTSNNLNKYTDSNYYMV